MNIKLFSLYKNRKKGSAREINFLHLIQYFLKLKIGEISGKIYETERESNFTIRNLNIIKDIEILDPYIRKTLHKISSQNVLDVNNRNGLEHIGYGFVITPALFGNLIAVTQGDATVYFNTGIKKIFNLKLTLFAIPKITGHIKFEDKIIGSFSIPTLAEREISFQIESRMIQHEVSKITISTERHWSSRFLDNSLPNILFGIAVKKIELC